jgi:hypothetical protein
MKTKIDSYLASLLIVCAVVAGCNKDREIIVPVNEALEAPESFPGMISLDSLYALETIAEVPFPQSARYNCTAKPFFRDSVIYGKSGAPHNHIVRVDNNPGNGKFFSWPAGLAIDSITGSINVSASQGGFKYAVGFVKNGSKDTCLQNIIIAGASYLDGVYVIGNNDTIARPYFNGDPSGTIVCDASNDNDYPGNSGNGNAKCEFDAADQHGKKGRANGKHVKVRTVSGEINLKRTLAEGAFGSTSPSNGQGIVVPVYYRLNDKGGKALQKISVQIVFFDSKDDIPTTLLAYIARKRVQAQTKSLIFPSGTPRPPLIVITRS